MKTFDYTVKDELGIHARPAGLLVKQISGVKSSVTIAVKAKDRSADAKRLMAVMKMAVKQGDVVTVTIEGEDEDVVFEAIQKFFHITVPLLKPTSVYVLTISIYGGMAMFTESYILFNGNSSPNNIGLTIVGYLYKMGFEQNNIGLGSAIGVVLLCIVLFFRLKIIFHLSLFRPNISYASL